MSDEQCQQEYLLASIQDMQGTIRAIDAKMSFLLVVLIIPLTKLGAVYVKCEHLIVAQAHVPRWIFMVSTVAFALSWIASMIITFRAVGATDNPASHITGDTPSGTFYAGDLFGPAFLDCFRNRDLKSSRPLREHLDLLPRTPEATVAELAFEQMKLSYIRAIKVVRCQWAFRICMLWLFLGAILWVSHQALI